MWLKPTRMIYSAPAHSLMNSPMNHCTCSRRCGQCCVTRSFIWSHAARVNLVRQIAERNEPHWKLHCRERQFQFGLRKKEVITDLHFIFFIKERRRYHKGVCSGPESTTLLSCRPARGTWPSSLLALLSGAERRARMKQILSLAGKQ